MNDSYDFLKKSPKQMSMDIASRVRKRRKERKWSQAELSRRADVSLGSLKRFESTGEISLSSLIKLGYTLHCQDDFDHLFEKRIYSSIEEIIREQR